MRMYVDSVQEARIRAGDLSGLGGFATFNAPARSEFQARTEMALTQAFKPNERGPLYIVELETIAPTKVHIGVIGPQITKGAYYSGGGTQILLQDYGNRAASFKIVSPPTKLGSGG